MIWRVIIVGNMVLDWLIFKRKRHTLVESLLQNLRKAYLLQDV